MRLSVLGPLVLGGDHHALGPRDRVVLAVLASRPGSTVRTDAIADALWGEAVPASSAKVVQGCVMRLRRALGVTAIETVGGGGAYRLALHHDEIDATVFADAVSVAADLLADRQPDRAHYHAGRALDLWRGDPLPELEDWPGASAERAELVEQHHAAEEVRAAAAVDLGLHAEVVPELLRLAGDRPTRERRWQLLALAEYRSGRQADALATLRRARRILLDDFGLDPSAELGALEVSILAQAPALDLVAPAFRETECPYPGLLAYDVGDTAMFYGREPDIAACLALLDRSGVLAVVGPSGCGKSSLVRAGLAASLVRDGRAPTVVTPATTTVAALAALEPGTGGVLVVDQLEELFTAPREEQDRFVAQLLRVVADGSGLVLGIRADTMGELSSHVQLARRVEGGLHLVGPMSDVGLRRAIRGPAEQAGLSVEPGLEELLVREVEGQPAALPLLSHVLRATWAEREGRTLTVAGYRSTGGIQEAVSRTAEDLYRALAVDDQELLRQLMTRLVSTDEDAASVRHRVPVRTVGQDDSQRQLVDRLVDARLLSSDGENVEIAHESLTLAWPRLRSWLDEDVEGARAMRHLSVAAQTWEAMGRPESELYRGARQQRVAEWRRRDRPRLTEVEAAFLDESEARAAVELREGETRLLAQRRTNRRLRAGLAAVAVLAVV
ncbi:nSTAND1 domain-containing NTPase, partial [Knoellia aerolata]|uniref:nSTAND1 domain-containing NTPase n=1 Tax=Knoellia aerolata TaxID=442954 RepID=UPI001B80D9CF